MEYNIINITLISLFGLFGAVQVYYYLYFYLGLKSKNQTTNKEFSGAVSIIICAKNESENLKKFLPKVLNQDYANYEVIVVDDASEDNTQEILTLLEQKYKNLRHTIIPQGNKTRQGKKLAQTVGIKSAKNNILLFTDADCFPESDQWIKQAVSNYSKDNTEIVLLYGKYEKTRGLLNKLIRFDAFFIAQQYLSFAKQGITYMGVGRNLSYKKDLFFKNKGFASHLALSSGDDDLFINEVATKQNVSVEILENSYTVSVPKTSFGDWIYQKARHISSSVKYKTKHKILIAAEFFSRFFFYGLFVLLLTLKVQIITAIVFVIVFAVKFIVFKKNLSLLKDKDLLLYWALFDILMILITAFMFLKSKLTDVDKWK